MILRNLYDNGDILVQKLIYNILMYIKPFSMFNYIYLILVFILTMCSLGAHYLNKETTNLS